MVVNGNGGGDVTASAEQLQALRRVLYAVLSDEEERRLTLGEYLCIWLANYTIDHSIERYFVCHIDEPECINQLIRY